MSSHTRTAESSSPLRTLPELGKKLVKLAPRQIQDEIQIGLLELKKKGIGVGVAAGFFGAALLLLSCMLTSLLVSLIAVIADAKHLALIALIVAGVFLLLAAVLGLIGFSRLKKNLPLKPNRAIKGLKHDLGVLKEGQNFDERSLVDTRTKEQREQDAKRAAQEKANKKRVEQEKKGLNPDAKPLTLEQLMSLTAQRRQNIAAARDGIFAELPIQDPANPTAARYTSTGSSKDQFKAQAAEKLEAAKAKAALKAEQAKALAAEKAQAARQLIEDRASGSATPAGVRAAESGTVAERLKERKGAVATAGASLSAFALLAKKLSDRK